MTFQQAGSCRRVSCTGPGAPPYYTPCCARRQASLQACLVLEEVRQGVLYVAVWHCYLVFCCRCCTALCVRHTCIHLTTAAGVRELMARASFYKP
jgi:hypothetical protein